MSQITTYEQLLLDIQEHTDASPRLATLLPETGQICEIDLNTRIINSPEFLSVQYDHNAEIIYFKCARYLDNIDLATTVCLIEYVNAEHLKDENNPNSSMIRDSGLFWVPYYDVDHYDEIVDENNNTILEPVMYIPWSIGGLATKYSGTITFAVRFYRLTEDGAKFLYNMSTRPTNGIILHGMDILDGEDIEKYSPDVTALDEIYHNLSNGIDSATTYWMDV